MFHLLKIEEIKHLDCNGDILWESGNINNVFHLGGEEFLLKVSFNTAGGVEIPSSYYLGLDNRTTLSLTDTLSNLSQEPTQFGYSRQSVSSANGFSVELVNENYKALSDVVVFSASGGTWGPIRNLFLATSSGSSGYLISSAALDTPRSVDDGQSMTIRISITLRSAS